MINIIPSKRSLREPVPGTRNRDFPVYNKACIESFHSVLKKEEVHRTIYKDFNEANKAIFEYIESWYNRSRIHSSINYMTPQQKEEEVLGAA